MPEIIDLIPHRPPFLFVDRIVSQSADGLVAARTWRAEEDFYQGHYPGAPITPGVLLCEAVFQSAACYLALKARSAGGKYLPVTWRAAMSTSSKVNQRGLTVCRPK